MNLDIEVRQAVEAYGQRQFERGQERGLQIAERVLHWTESGTWIETGEEIDRKQLCRWIRAEIERAKERL